MYYDGAYAPYGENYSETGTTDRNFTGQNQDTTADLYDFMFREYHPTQGRWLSPDPLGGDISNPQSLNRYAYVLNNPTNFPDPLGLECTDNVWNQNGGLEGLCACKGASFWACNPPSGRNPGHAGWKIDSGIAVVSVECSCFAH